MPKYFSLKNKISIISAAIILIAGFLVCVAIFFYLRGFLLTEKYTEIKDKTVEKSVETERVIENNQLFIKMIATKIGVQEYMSSIADNKNSEDDEEGNEEEKQAEEKMRNRLQEMFDIYAKDDSKYLSVYLMDKEGNTLISTDRSFIGKNYSFRDYFQKGLKGSKAINTVIGKTSNQFGFYFSHPVINNSGEVLGVAVAKVDGSSIFKENVSDIRLGMDNIFLIDSYGIVVGAIDESNLLKSLGELSQEEKKALEESRRFGGREVGFFDYKEVKDLIISYQEPVSIEIERNKNIFSISKVFDSDFFVVSRIDLAKVEASIYPIITMIIIVVIVACMVVSLFIYFLIRRSLLSLDKIKTFSENLIEGDFSQKIAIKDKSEIGILAETFNSLSDKLKNYYSTLEKRVADKTYEAEQSKFETEKQQRAILNILDDVEWEKKNVSKEKEKIDAILHSIGDGVFVVDENLKIIMVNHVTSEISGFSEKELIGKKYNSVLKFIFEKDGKENREFMDKAIETGETQEMKNHTMIVRKDGEKTPVADSAAPLKDKDGKVIGCVVVFRDVAKEREVDRMKTEFVSLASHQLRTPLTSIKWYAELILNNEGGGKIDGDKMDFVKEIHGGNERMIELVNDLLNVSRIETGRKFTIEMKKAEIIPIIKEAIKEHEVIAKQKDIEIICEKKIDEKTILNIDKEKILQVFHNFISNAIKYSPEGKKIYIGCAEEDERYVFHVKDEGAGIPKEQQPRIFEKFFRASNVLLTGAEGTGLGLYIAKSIVEGHGGKTWFESEENKGTTFFVGLPKINE